MSPNETDKNTPPVKVFISYAWGSEEYNEWVRHLAEEIANYNTIVELDQWSLPVGANKYVYMERMVNDENIKKVLILCDKKYKEKANDREGGAGTEATIISPEIYKNAKKNFRYAKIYTVDNRKK